MNSHRSNMADSFKVSLKESEKILEKCFSEKVSVLQVDHTPLSNVHGIMGGHFNLAIKFKRDERESEKVFFQKRTTTRYKIQDVMIRAQGAFQKEAFVYTTFADGLKGRIDIFPECYFLKDDLYFVLEHLVEKGFKTRPPDEVLYDLQHVRLALETVAKLHAGSIIYEHQSKQSLLEQFPEIFKEPLWLRDDSYLGNRLYVSGYKTILKLLDLCPHFEGRTEEIKQTFLQNVDHLYELVKPSKKYFNVVNHGDLWAFNLLFRYKGEIPSECKLVDFQALRYTIPAHDVMNLLHCVTEASFREVHLSELLRHYYDAFEACLRENGLKVEDYMTWEMFEESCEYILPFAVIQKSIFFMSVMFGIKPEIFSDEVLFEKFMYEEEYKGQVCFEEYKKKGFFYMVANECLSEFLKLKPLK